MEKITLDSQKIKRLRRIAQILDNAIQIPGTKQSIGLDPILGLIPGGGDTITGVLGAYIIIEAARMGISRDIIWQMVGNILFDSIAGTVPVVGDLFDAAWKANVRNMALLEDHLSVPQEEESSESNLLFLIGLTVLLLVIVVGFAVVTFFILRWLFNLIAS